MDIYSFHQSLLNGGLNLFTWTHWNNESLELLLKFLQGLRMAAITTQWQQIHGFQMVLQRGCVNMHSGFVTAPFFLLKWQQIASDICHIKANNFRWALAASERTQVCCRSSGELLLALQAQKLHQYSSDCPCPHFKQEFVNNEKIRGTVLNIFSLS